MADHLHEWYEVPADGVLPAYRACAKERCTTVVVDEPWAEYDTLDELRAASKPMMPE